MSNLLLVPLVLAAVLQVVAGLGAPIEASSLGFSTRDLLASLVTYWLAAVASLAAAVLLFLRTPGALGLAALAGVLICAAPLLWGRATHQSTPSHHLVRLAIVVVVLLLCWWHVSLHR